jgi:hypothetical protein
VLNPTDKQRPFAQASDLLGHAKIDHATVDELSQLPIKRGVSILVDVVLQTCLDLALSARA